MAKKRRKGASAAFLRALRKKHGLGEFKKSSKSIRSKRFKRSVRVVSLARRRVRRAGSSGGSSFNKEVVGAFLYGAIGENLLDQMTSKINIGVGGALGADLLKGVVGYFVAKKTTGVIRGMGQAAVAVSAYKVGKSGLSLLK